MDTSILISKREQCLIWSEFRTGKNPGPKQAQNMIRSSTGPRLENWVREWRWHINVNRACRWLAKLGAPLWLPIQCQKKKRGKRFLFCVQEENAKRRCVAQCTFCFARLLLMSLSVHDPGPLPPLNLCFRFCPWRIHFYFLF